VRSHFASLTSRLVLTAVALVAVVSLVIGVTTTLAVRAYLTSRLDDDVRGALQRAQHGPVLPPGPGGQSDQDDDGPEEIQEQRGQGVGTLTAVWIAGQPGAVGDVITQGSEGQTHRRDLSPAALDLIDALPADGRVHHVDLPGFGSYRIDVKAGPDGKVAAGLPTDDVDAVVSTLVWWELLLTLLGVGAAAGAGLVVVRRQLRPLREVAQTAHNVAELPLASGEIDLTERVPEHLTDERTEVGQVGSALNTLLAHVESSLEARHRSEQQVRQFVADASHELRTPLTTIAGYTELARRRPADAGTALGKVEEESGRMTALVEDLLLLARLDAGRPLEREPVDLTRLLLEAVSDARVVAPDHRWRLDLPDDAVEVTGDAHRLHQVVTNLLANARKYTPAGTTVTVSARRTPDGGSFAVHDDGPGFPSDLVEHAFERFARGDVARTRASGNGEQPVGGAGLGLSLVEAIVHAHGGRVSLISHPGDTAITVNLPG
jgi:two-component system, OmpR family, sensor kinase